MLKDSLGFKLDIIPTSLGLHILIEFPPDMGETRIDVMEMGVDQLYERLQVHTNNACRRISNYYNRERKRNNATQR